MFICKPAGHSLGIFGERGLDRPLCDVLTDNEFMDTGDVNTDQIHRSFEKEAAWEDKADQVCKILRAVCYRFRCERRQLPDEGYARIL